MASKVCSMSFLTSFTEVMRRLFAPDSTPAFCCEKTGKAAENRRKKRRRSNFIVAGSP
jgi:hypothetical protein